MQLSSPSPKSQKKYWLPSEAKWLKLNVDEAIFSEQSKTSVGCAARDDQGKVIMVATQPKIFNDDPLKVELRAILGGMQLCLRMGLRKIVVEIDCLIAVQALNAGSNSFACYHHLLYEILSLKD